MTVMTARPPADPEAWVWHPTDWRFASEESVQRAEGRTRSQARARFAHSYCDYIDTVAWKRHARSLDRQEQWEWWADQRGWQQEDAEGAWQEMPNTPPDGWEPDPWNEDMPVWQICRPEDDGAVAVWICGVRGDRPPHKPCSALTEEQR